jgi:colicin import membrane protein
MSCALKKDPGLGGMFAFSLLLHLSLFGIVYQLNNFLRPYHREAQTYYVDLVNLPVANPQSGTPSTSKKSSSPSPVPARQEMKLPANVQKKAGSPAASPTAKKVLKEIKPAETGKEFAERLAHLEKKVEEKHEESAIESIREKAASGRTGIPGGRGKEAGSDYASYVQSRLKDAFSSTIATQSKNPEVVVRLRINRFGKIVGYRTERSSRDTLFEASVARAISIAGENLPPPPGGEVFEHGYIFRPEGVGRK